MYKRQVMMSSTEIIFYTMSVYFMSVKVKKTRYTLAGALLATVAGTIASVVILSLIHISEWAQELYTNGGTVYLDGIMTVSYTHLDVYKRQG